MYFRASWTAVLLLSLALAACDRAEAPSKQEAGPSVFAADKASAIVPEALSSAYTVGKDEKLTSAQFASLIKTAFQASVKQDDATTDLAYTAGGMAYVARPLAHFNQGSDHYLVFDRLEADETGSAPDCHACGGHLAALRYTGDTGKPVIGKIWPSLSETGAWGSSGTVFPIQYKDGRFGFAVFSGSLAQGAETYSSQAYVIQGDAISEQTSLARSGNFPAPQ